MRTRKGIGWMLVAALCVLGAASYMCPAGPGPGGGPLAAWTDTDWSAPNSFEGAENVETQISPGMIALAGDPAQMRAFVNPADPPGWHPRSFFTMAAHQGKLYAGYGGPPIGETHQQPPEWWNAEVWEYDAASGQPMANRYTYNAEGIIILKSRQGRLWTPEVDSGMPWTDAGIHYSSDGQAWTRRGGMWAFWLYDLELFQNRVYVTACGYIGNNYYGPAQLYASDLDGQAWSLVRDDGMVGKHYAMKVFQGKLFVQPKNNPPLNDTILMFDGTTWRNTPVPGMPGLYEDLMGRFAEFNGKLYFHLQEKLFRFNPDPLNPRWEPIFCPVGNGAGGWASGFAAVGGGLHLASGYDATTPGFYRTTNPDDPASWGARLAGFEPIGPYLWGEKVRDFVGYRGRLYASTNNPYDGWPVGEGWSQGGAIYVAGAYPQGYLKSNVHDFGALVLSGVLTAQGTREGVAPGVKRATTDFEFRFRAAASAQELENLTFTGPDGTEWSAYGSGQELANHHLNQRFYQYKVSLRSDDARYVPTVDEVTLLATLDGGGGKE